MQEQPSLNPTLVWPHCIRQAETILLRIARLLQQVARSSGLGEVLQDYAGQSARQLDAMLKAAGPAFAESAAEQGHQPLASISFTLNGVKTVLDMLPGAMTRNKSEMIGEKEKWTQADILALKTGFLASPTIAALLQMENHAIFIMPEETFPSSGAILQ